MTDDYTIQQIDAHAHSVVGLARTLQESKERRRAEALRYAVLKRAEDELDLPALVKYGQSRSVKQTWGRDGPRVWEAVPDSQDHTLFYVEWETEPTRTQRQLLNRTMLAIGAWRVGEAGTADHPANTHTLFVWPNDHPVLSLVPGDD